VSRQTELKGNGRAPGARPGDADRVLGFTVPARDVRGRIVRLDGLLNDILSAHDYPEAMGAILAEALVLTALLGTTLRKDEGQLTLQAQSSGGAADLLVCDYRAGELRGYLKFDQELAEALPERAPLEVSFGVGHLAITLEQTAADERYQGIVPLEGASLSEAAEHYFRVSEQLPTMIHVAARRDAAGWSAGGLLVQHWARPEVGGVRLFASGDHPDWAHVHALAATVRGDELLNSALTFEEILWRLFHEEEVRVTPAVPLGRGCRCSADYIRQVLSRFPSEDLAEMREPNGLIYVECEFCALRFPVEV
jgi:molecular chaperone Hsp33